MSTDSLHAAMHVEFPYTRSLGPVLSTFMTGLVARKVVGGVLSDGRVAVPPPEYDPETLAPTSEFREVSDTGEVLTWSWVNEPVAGQPLATPFAWALVRLDGADTGLLHAVAADGPEAMSTGMRVRARWAPHRVGAITDIAHFEPESAGSRDEGAGTEPSAADPVTVTTTPVILDYDYVASPEESAFGRGLKEGRILAQACPKCRKVYVPPRGACPVDGVPTSEPHELSDTGIVTTFCIVNVPFLGQKIKPPYVSAYVLLDGADIAFLHLVLGTDAENVRMGMRVRAVWKPESEREFSMENISHFEPTGEPDADFDTYKNHL